MTYKLTEEELADIERIALSGIYAEPGLVVALVAELRYVRALAGAFRAAWPDGATVPVEVRQGELVSVATMSSADAPTVPSRPAALHAAGDDVTPRPRGKKGRRK